MSAIAEAQIAAPRRSTLRQCVTEESATHSETGRQPKRPESLYEYMVNNLSAGHVEAIIRKSVYAAKIPESWYEDARQEILINWTTNFPDYPYSWRELHSYAARVAYHEATRFAAHTVPVVSVPPGELRRGKRSYSVPIDETPQWIFEEWKESSLEERILEKDTCGKGAGAHEVEQFGDQRKRRMQTMLISWLSNGLDLEEFAEAVRLSKRSIYGYIADLKKKNRASLESPCS